MTDNFLSNSNYYNKGGLNGKPKEPRPITPKGQQSSNKSELIFKQLIHERNELRKYIVNICELLGIDTSQSILGANCLEFYAVLCSAAENKIKDLQEQLKRKEEECEELHNRTASIIYNLTGGRLSYSTYTLEACEQAYRDQLDIDVEKATRELQVEVDKYKQALDEIEKIISEEVILWDEVDRMTVQILNIINKVKEK